MVSLSLIKNFAFLETFHCEELSCLLVLGELDAAEGACAERCGQHIVREIEMTLCGQRH